MQSPGIQKKKVLLSPLNWGLGHATRMIPVIHELQRHNFDLYIGGDGAGCKLLKDEFPGLHYIHIPSAEIHYGHDGNLLLSLIWQMPKIIRYAVREHRQLKRLLRSYGFSFVIADNRFGLWNKKAYCIYITHQVRIKLPPVIRFLERMAYRIHKKIIDNFDKCWIPDIETPDQCFAGELSHGRIPSNALYIGILSRFEGLKDPMKKISVDVLIVLSGPEPQRTILEDIILHQAAGLNYRFILIRGTAGLNNDDKSRDIPGNVCIMDHAGTGYLNTVLRSAKYIICRSGYSTIMDLLALKRTALLIPTPGQTEQEYLAGFMSSKGRFLTSGQHNFNLHNAIRELSCFKPVICDIPRSLMAQAVESLAGK